MPDYVLTKKQHEVYAFITSYIEKHNCAPYIREIQAGCSIACYKGAIDKLLALERKGYIQRKFNKHRSIVLNKSETRGLA